MLELEETMDENEDEIVIPKQRVRYIPQVSYVERKVFDGKVVPIPFVLLMYLHETEMKIVSVILDQIRTTGHCIIRVETMAKMLGMTKVSISNAYASLKRMNIVTMKQHGRIQDKSINFRAVQKLHEVTDGLKPGAIAGLRRVMKDRDITDIPPMKKAIWLDKYIYKDEIEEEEYN